MSAAATEPAPVPAPPQVMVPPVPTPPQVVQRGPIGEEMRVSASSNPQSLASAISHAVYDNRQVLLRAVGAGAVTQAMKAITIARGFVAPRGFDIGVVPGWATVIGSKGDELSAMTFRVIQYG